MKLKIEGFIEILIVYLFRYPGAFVRWMLTGFRTSFRDIVEKDAYLNAFIGLVADLTLILIVKAW